MSELEVALAALVAFHTKLGVDIEPTLLPPVDEAKIQAVESQIGFRLPDDLRDLYKIANGQLNPYDDEQELLKRLDSEKPWAPLFGFYEFLTIDRAFAEYQFLLDMYEDEKERNEKHNNTNPAKTRHPNISDVRDGDPVDPLGWNPKWFPFAHSNADIYSIDMTPTYGGSPGQVVEHGADVAHLSVVASSVLDLMEQAALRLDPEEQNRYQRSDGDGDFRATVYFDLDWRNEPYEAQTEEFAAQQAPEYEAWIVERQQIDKDRHAEFLAWLVQEGVAEEDIPEISIWAQIQLSLAPPNITPEYVQNALNATAIARGEPALSREMLPHSQLEKYEWYNYYKQLAWAALRGNSRSYVKISNDTESVASDRLDLLHRFYLESGAWTKKQYRVVMSLRAEIDKVVQPAKVQKDAKEIAGASAYFYSVGQVGNAIEICQSRVDEETYKVEKVCTQIDVEKFR